MSNTDIFWLCISCFVAGEVFGMAVLCLIAGGTRKAREEEEEHSCEIIPFKKGA